MQTKICSKCKKEIAIEKFYKNKSTKSGYCAYCKPCQKKSVHNNHIKKRDKMKCVAESKKEIIQNATYVSECKNQTSNYRKNTHKKKS